MAISNQERVGKAMELLRAGLAPYAERDSNNLHEAQADAAALAYSGLVQSWPEIARLAREGGKPKEKQSTFAGEA